VLALALVAGCSASPATHKTGAAPCAPCVSQDDCDVGEVCALSVGVCREPGALPACDEECRGDACAIGGACTAIGGTCVAASNSECAQSVVCYEHDRCCSTDTGACDVCVGGE